MTDAPLPPGYTARPATTGDAEQVAALIAACQAADGEEPQMSPEELLEDWERIEPANQAVVVTAPNGAIAAYADIVNRGYVRISVYGYVHPSYRGLGLGAYLAGWGTGWARDHMHLAPGGVQVVIEHYMNAANASARQLMETRGYRLARTVHVMAIELNSIPSEPQWPPGIDVHTFRAGQDEQEVFEAGEEAFADLWSRPPGTLESWIGPTRSPGFDPSMWFLAEVGETNRLAGLCLCQIVTGRGWIATVGVRRAWRGRGLGMALLHHAFRVFYERGVRYVELSVDSENPTGAPRLYTRAGMHVEKRYLIYRKELRTGDDLSRLT